MARFLSDRATIMRGSIGGTTFLGNQYHALVARARTAPVQPNTNPQTLVRSSFAGALQRWLNMTPTERAGWDDYAATCPYTGPLGGYNVNGRSMYIACMGTAIYMKSYMPAIVLADTAPAIPGWLNCGGVTAIPPITPGTGIAVAIVNESTEDAVIMLQRSFSYSQTRMRFKGPYLNSSTVVDDAPDSTSTAFEMLGLTVNMVYFTRIRAMTKTAPFRLSALWRLRHIAEVVV